MVQRLRQVRKAPVRGNLRRQEPLLRQHLLRRRRDLLRHAGSHLRGAGLHQAERQRHLPPRLRAAVPVRVPGHDDRDAFG